MKLATNLRPTCDQLATNLRVTCGQMEVVRMTILLGALILLAWCGAALGLGYLLGTLLHRLGRDDE